MPPPSARSQNRGTKTFEKRDASAEARDAKAIQGARWIAELLQSLEQPAREAAIVEVAGDFEVQQGRVELSNPRVHGCGDLLGLAGVLQSPLEVPEEGVEGNRFVEPVQDNEGARAALESLLCRDRERAPAERGTSLPPGNVGKPGQGHDSQVRTVDSRKLLQDEARDLIAALGEGGASHHRHYEPR